MGVIVKRTVRLIQPKDDRRLGKAPLTLRDFETDNAYVLLGEPGMGKSVEFEEEAKRVDAQSPVPASRFINRNPHNHPEWQKGPLFIDGLDEARIGRGDQRDALDKIIDRLEELRNPKFRLSCRSLSWLGTGDREELNSLTGSVKIPVLQLNPLSKDDIRKIVFQLGGDVDTFIQEAHEHDMGIFLNNPQLLSILFKSVENDGWSNSPRETFEKACRELVSERNEKYRGARSFVSLPPNKTVLSAAGQLSVLMLIANRSGWSVDNTEDPEILSLLDVETNDRETLRIAFDSGLFDGSIKYRTPIHRLLAEFLGARYLHERIEDGLSVRRALALLMGHDGLPFPDLRGLIAWLASFNSQARGILMCADPVAVAFDGDASSFSFEERRQLLRNLECKIDLTNTWPSEVSLGALAGDQGMTLIEKISSESLRSRGRQMIVYILLRGFSKTHSGRRDDYEHRYQSHSENDQDNLLAIVNDTSWRENVRCEALRALSIVLIDSPDRGRILREILEDVGGERFPDDKNYLLGTLLDIMYPDELRPAEVWNYIVSEPDADSISAQLKFYSSLVKRSTAEQVKELLDSLCDQASEVIPKLRNNYLADKVSKLLERGIESFGDEMDIPKLYRWFKLVEPYDYSSHKILQHSSPEVYITITATILDWLRQRINILYALIEYELYEKEHKIGIERMLDTICHKFLGRSAPEGFRLWCLNRAAELWGLNNRVAEELACWSICSVDGWEPPLSDDEIRKIVSGISGLTEWNTMRLKAKARTERRELHMQMKQEMFSAKSRKKKHGELEQIRQQITNLVEGSCPPLWLHSLAKIYWRGYMQDSEDPRSRLESHMCGDESLVSATLAGFRSVLKRDDLPNLDEIAQSYENRRISLFALPFVAGMEEQERESGDSLSRLCEKGRRRALGFHLVTDLSRQGNISFGKTMPLEWYKQALIKYPRAVADSIVAIHITSVRSGTVEEAYLFDLAFDPAHEYVAQLALSRMFAVFPARCRGPQLKSLRVVLWSAILTRGVSSGELHRIILNRLNLKSMDSGQKALWLCAGVCIDRSHFLPLLVDFLSAGNKVRARHVIRFLAPEDRESLLKNFDDWTSEEIALIIQGLGRHVQVPRKHAHQGSNYAGDLEIATIQSLITSGILEISERIEESAAEALASLADNINLKDQNREIKRALENQAINRRTALRPNLTLEQIQKALQGDSPASTADLAALTTDVLEDLAYQIRNGQTSDWHHYWHWRIKPKKPLKPKSENDCRNLLLSYLKLILRKYQIDAQPEGQYADDNRADIRVSYRPGFAIPIEIKKNESHDIWRGIIKQLVPKYTRDPDAEGYGIYLVFWFGVKHMKAVAPDGDQPSSPEELKCVLKGQLDRAIQKKIHVVVINVSPSGRYVEEGD